MRIRERSLLPLYNVSRKISLPPRKSYDDYRGRVGDYYGFNRTAGDHIVQLGTNGIHVDAENVEFLDPNTGSANVPCSACGKIASRHSDRNLFTSMNAENVRLTHAASYVDQDTYALRTDPHLHTHGLATCVALSMKVGSKNFLAHLSAMTDVEPIVAAIQREGRPMTDVQLYGGTGGSKNDPIHLDDPHKFALEKAHALLARLGIPPRSIPVQPVCFAEIVPNPRAGATKFELSAGGRTTAAATATTTATTSRSRPSKAMSVSVPVVSAVPTTLPTTAAAVSDYKPLIVEALNTMRLGELAAEGGKFKAIAYSKAIASIKRFEGPITSAAQLKECPGVGAKIYKKIEEILATGRLAAANHIKETTNVGAVQTLLNIHGIGPVKVKALLAAGIKTVAALRAAFAADPTLLTDAQALGLKYYEPGLLRIPRPEMVDHERTLLAAVPASLTGVIVGSYRRGAADSGDIDMLVSYGAALPEKDAKKAFAAFVTSLTASGYIVDKLSSGPKKWMGYVRLPAGGAGASAPTIRRLDLLLTPPDELAYSILYFTGSDKFNVAMRKYVLTLGYSLSEHGLKLADAGRARPMPATPPRTEAEIFTFFGLRYVPPTERVDGRQIVALTELE